MNGTAKTYDAVAEKAATSRPKLVRILGRFTGGPARQACLLHEQLATDYHTHLIAGNLCTGESEMDYLLGSNDGVFRINEMSREISMWSDLCALWKIYRFLRRERPEIVHTHTAKAGALGRLAAWLAGVPMIIHTYHGHVFHGYFSPAKTKAYLIIERVLGKLSTKIIAISESQKKELSETYQIVPADKISLISNGFDLHSFGAQQRTETRKALGIAEDRFVFAWTARMAPVKDVDLLAKVIRAQAEKESKAFFLVVGDGDEKPRLEQLIQGCNNVKLIGWHDNMDQIWGAADAGLLTSRNEGTPTALIEAMATGLPFVSTDVGGVKDLAVEPMGPLPEGLGKWAGNGFLTARTEKAMSFCIEQLMEVPGMAAEMGAAGRAFVMERFASERLIKEMMDLYRTPATPRHATPRQKKEAVLASEVRQTA
jgi:glycosyltransferase involved in cell wall biosynthesis